MRSSQHTRTIARTTPFAWAPMALACLSLTLMQAAQAEVLDSKLATGLFQYGVNLKQSASGSLSVTATFGDTEAEFLLDTGASMVTVNRELFQQLNEQGITEKVGQVGARLASGKIQLLDIYRVEEFVLGNCNLGALEIAVMGRGGRNLLGMNALQATAPFAIYTSPPALALSKCSSM